MMVTTPVVPAAIGGLIWGILGVLFAPRLWWSWAALGVVATLRLVAAIAVGRGVLADPNVLRDLWLLPVRDSIALALWLASFTGNTIEWRGLKFRVRDGRLEKV